MKSQWTTTRLSGGQLVVVPIDPGSRGIRGTDRRSAVREARRDAMARRRLAAQHPPTLYDEIVDRVIGDLVAADGHLPSGRAILEAVIAAEAWPAR